MKQTEFDKKWKPKGRGIPKTMTAEFESDLDTLLKEVAEEAHPDIQKENEQEYYTICGKCGTVI